MNSPPRTASPSSVHPSSSTDESALARLHRSVKRVDLTGSSPLALNGDNDCDRKMSSARRLRSGKQIGDFQIVRELGCGAMGAVYLATQLSLKRQVALKVLPFYLSSSAHHIERLEREAITGARLAHPGVGKVYSIGEAAGVRYLVMEYIEGHDLHEELKIIRGRSEDRRCWRRGRGGT